MGCKEDSLCWICKRPGTGTCAWDASKGKTPVNGWVAEKVQWQGWEGEAETYRVLSCPMYIHDRGELAPPPMSEEDKARVFAMYQGGARQTEIAKKMGVSQTTIKNKLYGFRKKGLL